MTEPTGDESPRDGSSGEDKPLDAPVCDEFGCSRPAAVILHIPWAENKVVCPAHARVLSRPDGIVAEPMAGRKGEWP